jgi:hypothetical protein
MELLTGKIVGGKVVLDGNPFAEGTLVTVVAKKKRRGRRSPSASLANGA